MIKDSDKKFILSLLTREPSMSFRCGRKELYRSSSKVYRVLHWDRNSNLVSSEEKNFENAEDAIKFFLEEIGA